MIDNFEQYIRQTLPELTDEQIARIQSMSVVKNVRRKDCLLREGEVCRHKLFVLRGLLRNYTVDKDGSEHTMRFTAEFELTTDSESYINQTPSQFRIEALEPTEVVLWNRDDFERLRTTIPAVNAFTETMMMQNINETQKRVLMNISATAEEKYQYFMTAFPHISRRVPLHMIASYLGVSRETLTRIRQGLALATKG